ncbi:unnamed protein product, partial [marine sediment metagenome]
NRFQQCGVDICPLGGAAISFLNTSIVIAENVIHSCHAHGYAGGILGEYSQAQIRRNVIADCSGFHGAGGLKLNSVSGDMTGNLILGNETTGFTGGGMSLSDIDADLRIRFCTIIGNDASYPDLGRGGGLYAASAPGLTIEHCVFWGNTAGDEGPQISGGPEVTVRYCDVEGGYAGDGNINAYPRFVDPDGPDGDPETWEDNDYRLLSDSPCINAGDPLFVPEPGETDFAGHARLLCEYVDIGAYEFGIGDYNCDRTVDLADF